MKVDIKFKDLETLLPKFKGSSFFNEDSYYKEYMTLEDSKIYRDLFLYPLSKDVCNFYSLHFINLFSALEKLTSLVLDKRRDLLNILSLEGLELRDFDREARIYFNYSRVDTVLTSEGFKVLEVNAKRPQMYEDGDWFSNKFSTLFQKEGYKANLENNTIKIAKSFKSYYQFSQRKKEPENVIVVYKGDLKKQPYALKRSIEAVYDQSNVEYIESSQLLDFLDNVQLIDGYIHYDGKRIDQLIMQYFIGSGVHFYKRGRLSSDKVREAYLNNKLVISTPPYSQVVGNKVALSMLKDPVLQEALDLSPSEVEAIGLIPLTINFQQVVNKSVDLKGLNHRDFLIKSDKSVYGDGVFFGENMSRAKFDLMIKDFTDRGVAFVIQEKLTFAKDLIFDLNEIGFAKAALTFEPFIVNDLTKSYKNRLQLTGYSTRAIRSEHLDRVKRFNPPGKHKEIMFGAVIEYED